jgi:arylsulfatase A-like enzyme
MPPLSPSQAEKLPADQRGLGLRTAAPDRSTATRAAVGGEPGPGRTVIPADRLIDCPGVTFQLLQTSSLPPPLCAALWLLLALGACAIEPDSPGTQAHGGNILVLLVDDIGVDKIRAYGEHPGAPPTPSIDALAARGVLFRNAYAPPTCSPSRAALLTGRHPRRYGLGDRLQTRADLYEVPLSELALPEALERSPLGYDQAAVGKWHLSTFNSPSGEHHPLLFGFRWYAGSFANLNITNTPGASRGTYEHWQKNTNGTFSFSDTYATTDTVNDALERIEALESPWFLWVAFNASHRPFHEPPPGLHTRPSLKTAIERFDAATEALDTEIGRLLDAMNAETLALTTVIFLSDNGTPRAAMAPPLDLSHGKGTLYEGGINIPLIISGSAVKKPGAESAALVHVVDVFATVAELTGVDVNRLEDERGAPVAIDGSSLLPYLEDPALPSQREFVFQDAFTPNGPGPYRSDTRMIRNHRYKLVKSTETGDEFFDLRGRTDDGPNLFGSLNPEQQAAYESLRASLADILLRLQPAGGER